MDKSVVDGISTANAAFADAFARGDVDALMTSFFAPGAMVDAGDWLPATSDPETIAAFYRSMRDRGFDRVELRTDSLEQKEDFAVETGIATMWGSGADQRIVIRYDAVWAKSSGAWRAQVNVLVPVQRQVDLG